MGLSMHERRVLAQIEHELTREDPLLATHLARLGPTRGRPRTGWLRSAMSTKLRRGLIAALAVLTGLSLLIAGQLSSRPGIGESRQELNRPAESCQAPKGRQAADNCVEYPVYEPPERPYMHGMSGRA